MQKARERESKKRKLTVSDEQVHGGDTGEYGFVDDTDFGRWLAGESERDPLDGGGDTRLPAAAGRERFRVHL